MPAISPTMGHGQALSSQVGRQLRQHAWTWWERVIVALACFPLPDHLPQLFVLQLQRGAWIHYVVCQAKET